MEFHVRDDYVTQQAQECGVRRRVANEQYPGTTTNHQSDCFSNFSYANWREVTKFENTEQPRVRLFD